MQTTVTWDDLLYPGKAGDFFARAASPLATPFDPNANGYSRTNALWLAELSRLVYRHDTEETNPPPQPTRTSFLAKANLRQRKFFLSNGTDTQAMLVEPDNSPTFAILVFRGTEQTAGDRLTDIDIGLPPLDQTNPDVHDGFKNALDSVWDKIKNELDQLAQNGCPVFYTGHSLGAALATLAAARRAPKALYTFGSPRVGNQAFADLLANIQNYRVVDDEDFVTTVPPEALGFRHAATEHKLIAPSSATSLWHLFNCPPKQLADHAPINYVDRI